MTQAALAFEWRADAEEDGLDDADDEEGGDDHETRDGNDQRHARSGAALGCGSSPLLKIAYALQPQLAHGLSKAHCRHIKPFQPEKQVFFGRHRFCDMRLYDSGPGTGVA